MRRYLVTGALDAGRRRSYDHSAIVTAMSQIGRWIAEVLLHRTDTAVLSKVRKQVLDLCEAFPLYAERRAKAQTEVRA